MRTFLDWLPEDVAAASVLLGCPVHLAVERTVRGCLGSAAGRDLATVRRHLDLDRLACEVIDTKAELASYTYQG